MTHRQKEIIEMLLKQAGYKLEGRMYVNNDIKSGIGVKEIFPDESPTSTGEGVQIEYEKPCYPAECTDCGWIGSSGHLDGGYAIGQTGDYADVSCPSCGSMNIEETDKVQPADQLFERLEKATGKIKYFREFYERSQEEKYVIELQGKPLIDKLHSLKTLHVNPYNLGEEGEVGRTIEQLYQLFKQRK